MASLSGKSKRSGEFIASSGSRPDVETPVALPYGCVVNLRFLSGSFQFEDDRTESVIAAADRHSGLPYPVAIIEKFLACTMSQCEDILVCFGIIYIFA